jgi:hypothetical protein
VGEARRDPQHAVIVGAQLDADPAPERGRGLAHVDADVEHASGHDADEFSLRPPDLVVQAAQHVAARARVVVLDERDIGADGVAEVACVEAHQQEAALVAEHLRPEDQDIGNRRRNR